MEEKLEMSERDFEINSRRMRLPFKRVEGISDAQLCLSRSSPFRLRLPFTFAVSRRESAHSETNV